MFAQRSLRQYLEAVAKREPVPGGGSAAAMVAAVGTALTHMVGVYSKSNAVTRRLLRKQRRIQEKLIELVDRDAVVFLRLHDAWKLPRDSTKRNSLVQRCLREAAEVPFAVCLLCAEALAVGSEIAKAANPRVVSDAGCAAYFLEAAFEAARINVDINIKAISQKEFVRRKKDALRRLSRTVKRSRQNICRFVATPECG